MGWGSSYTFIFHVICHLFSFHLSHLPYKVRKYFSKTILSETSICNRVEKYLSNNNIGTQLFKRKKYAERDCKRNFKWPSIQREQCPIYNGTLQPFVSLSGAEICVCKLIETRLYSDAFPVCAALSSWCTQLNKSTWFDSKRYPSELSSD